MFVFFFINLNYFKYINFILFRNVLIVVSYPFRFAIYCGMSQQFRKCVREMIIKLKFFPKNFNYNNKKKFKSSKFNSIKINAKIQRVLETKFNKNSLFEKKNYRNKLCASFKFNSLYAASIKKNFLNQFYCINNKNVKNNEISTQNDCNNFVNTNIIIKNKNNKTEYYEPNLIITKIINFKTTIHNQNNNKNCEIEKNEYKNLT